MIKRAELDVNGRTVFFEDHGFPQLKGEGAALVIEVDDFEDAMEVVDTLTRSSAQKRKERKPRTQALPPAPGGAANPPGGAGQVAGEGDKPKGGGSPAHRTPDPAAGDGSGGAPKKDPSAATGDKPTPAPPVKVGKLACGGTHCYERVGVEHHGADDPTCTKLKRKTTNGDEAKEKR